MSPRRSLRCGGGCATRTGRASRHYWRPHNEQRPRSADPAEEVSLNLRNGGQGKLRAGLPRIAGHLLQVPRMPDGAQEVHRRSEEAEALSYRVVASGKCLRSAQIPSEYPAFAGRSPWRLKPHLSHILSPNRVSLQIQLCWRLEVARRSPPSAAGKRWLAEDI
jgi:hypothetical protein